MLTALSPSRDISRNPLRKYPFGSGIMYSTPAPEQAATRRGFRYQQSLRNKLHLACQAALKPFASSLWSGLYGCLSFWERLASDGAFLATSFFKRKTYGNMAATPQFNSTASSQ
jgi:hypothetical protein